MEDAENPRSSASEMLEQISAELREAAERLVPRFLETMPPEYFRGTDPATRLSHVKALIATAATGLPQRLSLRSEDGSRYTVLRERSYPGQLAELVAQLPSQPPLRAARVHTARDGRLVLDVFDFGQQVPFDRSDSAQAARADALLEHARRCEPDLAPGLEEHLVRCAADYLRKVPPRRICQHFRLFRHLQGSDDTRVVLEPLPDTPLSHLIVGIGNCDPREMFKRTALLLGRHEVDIQTAHLDHFGEGDGSVLFLSYIVAGPGGAALDPASVRWSRIRRDLLRAKWLDAGSLRLAERLPGADVTRAEILQALSHLIHQVLTRKNPFAYSRNHILETVERHAQLSLQVSSLFLDRFDPAGPLPEPDFAARRAALTERIAGEVDLDEERGVLASLIAAVEATACTNLYVPTRYALALEVEPRFLEHPAHEETPFSVLFVHGRDFDGFHVRFREIARGGLRIVRPRGPEQFVRESERLYEEAYGLALAQQLKNKDIPEGGSKGVLLAAPQARVELCGKAFASSLIDLAHPGGELALAIVDRRGPRGPLYLGPDENISDGLIRWIVEHAASRGYPAPNAFMSSKPGAGISHRAYGVTSEGVTVFLEVALRSLGIDPRLQPFSVKMTGGPDGDVAGNELRILHREFGENALVVGIADSSGCADDPEGLDHEELLRLVSKELPIARFDPGRLGPRGRVVSVEEPDGLRQRNSLHNRVVADAFIPAGGRPRTIHESNWSEFLTPGGSPSSAVIVEGANLFLTPEARTELSRRGVLIIKDSSANKCGVICSSFEILASMLLSEAEFLTLKEQFVAEVLTRLRELAHREAELLLREARHKPDVSLPELSTRLSRTIIAATDAIAGALPGLGERDRALAHGVMSAYLPPVLRQAAGERVFERVPRGYVHRTIATALAGGIVYREGLSYLEGMPRRELADLALRYLRQERETERLVTQIARSGLPDRERIAALLRDGATGAALRRGEGPTF